MFQHKLSLGVAAATIMGVSMVSVMPAQALTLEGDDQFSFGGNVAITRTGVDSFTFDFLNVGEPGSASAGITIDSSGPAPDPFFVNDQIVLTDIISQPEGLFEPFIISSFISDILLGDGTTTASFDVDTLFVDASPAGGLLAGQTDFVVGYDGLLKTSNAQILEAVGSITSQFQTSAIDQIGDSIETTFSGTLRVRRPDEITEVPTPAAILPTLFGLGGLAAKRKKQDEA